MFTGFVVDHVLSKESEDNKIEEQRIKFVFEILLWVLLWVVYWIAVVYIRRSSSTASVYFYGLERS